MEPTTRDTTVVQTVLVNRVYAIVVTLVALPALAVFIVLAQDRVEAIVSPMVEAVIWAVVWSLILSQTRELAPPVRIRSDQLPPVGSLRTALVPGVALYAVADAGAIAYSLAANQYFIAGMMLGIPIVIWDFLRKAKRTEREMHGTLWQTSNLAWRSGSRSRYLVART